MTCQGSRLDLAMRSLMYKKKESAFLRVLLNFLKKAHVLPRRYGTLPLKEAKEADKFVRFFGSESFASL